MKFAIGIPTLNRIDLLLPSLMLYKEDFKNVKIYVLDNGNQNLNFSFPNIEVIKSEVNLGVGASWNFLCEKIFENNTHAVILNDDIYLGKKEGEIGKIIEKKGNSECFLRATIDWCIFVIPRIIYNKVGKFDECFFPAYYEDKSYEYRMKLKGVPQKTTPELNPFIYQSSKTLEKEPQIIEYSKANKGKYIEMWGGEPNRETFKKPYNK